MTGELKKLIRDRLETELGFAPGEDESARCVERAQCLIAEKLAGLLSQADWDAITEDYEYDT